jgi:hypothetical protein
MGRGEVQLHSFLTLALNGGLSSGKCPGKESLSLLSRKLSALHSQSGHFGQRNLFHGGIWPVDHPICSLVTTVCCPGSSVLRYSGVIVSLQCNRNWIFTVLGCSNIKEWLKSFTCSSYTNKSCIQNVSLHIFFSTFLYLEGTQHFCMLREWWHLEDGYCVDICRMGTLNLEQFFVPFYFLNNSSTMTEVGGGTLF